MGLDRNIIGKSLLVVALAIYFSVWFHVCFPLGNHPLA